MQGTKTGNRLYQIPLSQPVSGLVSDNRSQRAEIDEVEDEEQSDEEPEPEVAERFRPSFDNPQPEVGEIFHPSSEEPQPEMESLDQQEEVAENKRVTRYRGKKHVKIYEMSVTPINNKKIKPIILGNRIYHLKNNFDLPLFRGENKSSFFARKRALIAHVSICEQPFCDICSMAKKVKSFEFSPSNLSRYNQTIECSERRRVTGKKVCFKGEYTQEILGKKII